MPRIARIISSGLGLAAALALSTAPLAYADDTPVTLEIIGGTKSVEIDTLVWSDPDMSMSYSHVAQTPTALLSLTADDATGLGDGWHVTVESSDLTYTGSSLNATTIPANNLVAGTPVAPAMVAGQAIGVDGPFEGVGGALGSARRVLFADENGGLGTYTQDVPMTLTIPAQTRAGNYAGTLTVTITAGPGA
jgi:hypothetical protein